MIDGIYTVIKPDKPLEFIGQVSTTLLTGRLGRTPHGLALEITDWQDLDGEFEMEKNRLRLRYQELHAGQGMGRRPRRLHRARPPRAGQDRCRSSTRPCASSSTCATTARSSPRPPSAATRRPSSGWSARSCEAAVPTSNGIHCPECGEDMRGGEYVRAVLHLVDDADGRIYRGIDSLTVRSAGFPEYRGMSLDRIQGSNLWVSFRRYDPLPDEGIVLPTASVEMFEAQRSVIRQLQIGTPAHRRAGRRAGRHRLAGQPAACRPRRQDGAPPAGPQRGAGGGRRPRHGHAAGPALPDPGPARHRQDDGHRRVDPPHPRPQPERLDPALVALQRRGRHRAGAAARASPTSARRASPSRARCRAASGHTLVEGDDLEPFNLVAGTCNRLAIDSRLRFKMFDWLILDEANKVRANEALALMPLAKRWVMIGDLKQLPPCHGGGRLDVRDRAASSTSWSATTASTAGSGTGCRPARGSCCPASTACASRSAASSPTSSTRAS